MGKLFFIILLFTNLVSAKTVQEAFAEFYHSEKIGRILCRNNTYLFLKYLQENKISYQKAAVINYRDPLQCNYHYDARWGQRVEYVNGRECSVSNWGFHVFSIIDGMVYDFSMTGPKTMPLDQYLNHAYLPRLKTVKGFLRKSRTRDSELESFYRQERVELDIIEASKFIEVVESKKELRNNYDYKGNFIELFYLNEPIVNQTVENYNKGIRIGDYSTYYSPEVVPSLRSYSSSKKNPDGSVTYSNPQIKHNGVFSSIHERNAQELCLMLGHAGVIRPLVTIGTILTPYVRINISFKKKSFQGFSFQSDIEVSVPRTTELLQSHDIITSITCADLRTSPLRSLLTP